MSMSSPETNVGTEIAEHWDRLYQDSSTTLPWELEAVPPEFGDHGGDREGEKAWLKESYLRSG
jgi:hypothetical protein